MSEAQTEAEREPHSQTRPVPKSHGNPNRRKKKRTSSYKEVSGWAYPALTVLVFLVFFPMLSSDFLWSDFDLVERSPYQSMENWTEAWSLASIRHNDPISISTYFIEEALPCPVATTHRVINLLLHSTAALLLLRWLEALKLRAAFSAALVFALHPATVQTLFWPGYRTEVIGLILILGALYFGTKNRHVPDYILSLALTALAALIHPSAWGIPVILTLVIVYQERIFHLELLNRVLPHACICLFLRLWTSHGGGIEYRDFSLAEKLHYAGQNMFFYLQQTLAPFSRALFHPYKESSAYQVGSQLSLLPFLVFIPFYILIAFNFKKRWSRGILLGLTAYIVLALHGVQAVGHAVDGSIAMENHGQYIALAALIALLVTGLRALIHKLGEGERPLWGLCFTPLLLIEIGLTTSFTYAISAPNQMWSRMSKTWPDSWVPKAALISSTQEQANADLPQQELVELLNDVLDKRPELVELRTLLARTYVSTGQSSNALREYRRILRETRPENEFLEEAAKFYDTLGLDWEASKARQRISRP